MSDPKGDEFTEAETKRRRENALKRMLNTPPKPHAKPKPKAIRPKRKVARKTPDK